MATQQLFNSVQDFLDAEIRLQQRRSECGSCENEQARFDQAMTLLRDALAQARSDDEHDLVVTAREYLRACTDFEHSRDEHRDLDTPARALEKAQRDLTSVLSYHARRENSVEEDDDRPFRVLVAIDDNVCAEWAIAAANRLCKATTGRMLLVHVSNPVASAMPLPACDTSSQFQDQRERDLALIRRLAAQVPPEIPCETRLAQGPCAEALLSVARRWGADMVVIGTRGRSKLTRFLLGSTAEEVIRLASCPVLVVGSDPRATKAWRPEAMMSVGSDVV